MIRNLKALGLAFLAVFAFGALAAGSAQAEPGAGPAAFTAEEFPATIDGTDEKSAPAVFDRGSRSVTCEVAEYHATAEQEEYEPEKFRHPRTLTLVPTYKECHSIVLGTEFPATVTFPEGCHYIFHATADRIIHEDETVTDTFTAISDLTCPEGKDVSIDIYKAGTTPEEHENTEKFLCAYTFTNQSGLKTIDLTNKAAGTEEEGVKTPKDWITADLGVEGVTSLRTHGGALTCGAEHDTSGKLTGKVRLKGTNAAGEANGITVTTEPTI